MNATNQLTPIEDIMQESIEKTVLKLVEQSLERRLSTLAERIVSNVTDELNGLASNIEDVVSDALSSAERAGEPDAADVEKLQEELASDISKAIRERNLIAEIAESQAPNVPTIAQRYHTCQIGIRDVLCEALDQKYLEPGQVTALLKLLSTEYEADFALFLWRNKNGTV